MRKLKFDNIEFQENLIYLYFLNILEYPWMIE